MEHYQQTTSRNCQTIISSNFYSEFTNFDLQFYLILLLPHQNLSPAFKPPDLYPASILQPLMKSLHSQKLSIALSLLVIVIQSLPHSSNDGNLFFSPQSQISSIYICPLESFLTNLKTVLYIPIFSKNPTLTKKTYPTTGQYLTYLTYPNSQNDLLKPDSLTISCNENNLLNSFQSAYTNFNSTGTTCCTRPHYQSHDRVNNKSRTGLDLLDLFAAIDTWP